MTLTQDAHYWHDQTERATEIRPTLERLFLLAYNHGLVQPTEAGSWQYVGERETLIYDPISDFLSAKANDDSWRIDYHEQEFVPQANTEISDAQLQSCRENRNFLDQQQITQTPNLSEIVNASPNNQTAVLDTATVLFEQCAQAGMSADKDGNEWIYTVAVDDRTYLVSRNDLTGEYNVRNDAGTLDVKQSVGLSQSDVQIWENMNQFLVERPIKSSIGTPDWTQTIWDRQRDRANSILSAMETVMSHGKNVEFDGVAYRAEPLEGYICGYCTETDTRWLDRDDKRILTASNPHEHYDSDAATWSLDGLDNLGSLTAEETNYFESLRAWLEIVDRPFGLAALNARSETREENQARLPAPMISTALVASNEIYADSPAETRTEITPPSDGQER